jgi:hypothetical protein
MKITLFFHLANSIAVLNFGNIRMTLTSPWIYLDYVSALQVHKEVKP